MIKGSVIIWFVFIMSCFATIIVLSSCRREDAKPDNTAAVVWNDGMRTLNIYDSTVDGCHYLTTSRGGIVHKANCTNHVADLKLWQMQNAIAP